MSILVLLVYVLVGIIVVALALYAVTLLPDPPITPKFKNLMKLAIILAVIIALLLWLVGGGFPHIVVR